MGRAWGEGWEDRSISIPGSSLWRGLFRYTLIAEVPIWIWVAILAMAYRRGIYTGDSTPSPFLGWGVLELLFWGAICESFLVAGLAELLRRTSLSPLWICGLAGFAWGALHAKDLGVSFWSPAWGFFVYTAGYLAWRPRSFWHGYLVAMVPHLYHDIQWKLLTLR